MQATSGRNSKHETQQKYDYLAKVVIIGNSFVGKTNVMLRYVCENHSLSHTPTVGVDFKSKIVTVEGKGKSGSHRIKLQLWDTAGQERFRTITETYYNGASGIVLVYAIDDRKSFSDLTDWLLQISKNSKEELPKVILANKCDLTADRKVSFEEGRLLAQDHGALFMEVSAKQNINVSEAFLLLAKQIKKLVQAEEGSRDRGQSEKLKLTNERDHKIDVLMRENKKECC